MPSNKKKPTKKRRPVKVSALEKANLKADEIIKKRMHKTLFLLLVKGREYQRNGDKFNNFTRASEMMRVNKPRALHGMLQKHLSSYYDMLDDLDKGIHVSKKTIDEKLGDIIVYFCLQEALIHEHLAAQKGPIKFVL